MRFLLFMKCDLFQASHHIFGFHPFVELFGSKQTEIDGFFFQRCTVFVCGFGDLSCVFVTSISDLSTNSLMRSLFGSMPTAQ